MAMSREEIFSRVKETLVEALGVDEDEVVGDATLTGDLGAESIDFLDIVFRLEKAFNIKIPRGELFPENILNNPSFVNDKKLTDSGLAELRKRMAHADLTEFEKNPEVDRIAELFTVDAIVRYIESKTA
ncbi:MAG: acyl carrier protein [Actinobacteria bacterium]|nr:acyl carrier protein [Actinomycetota bacterium]